MPKRQKLIEGRGGWLAVAVLGRTSAAGRGRDWKSALEQTAVLGRTSAAGLFIRPDRQKADAKKRHRLFAFSDNLKHFATHQINSILPSSGSS